MKEYLITNALGKFYYTKTETPPPNMFCEIPDGAEMYVKMSHANRFAKKVNGVWMAFGDTNWVPFYTNVDPSINNEILWRRKKTVEYLDPYDWSLVKAGVNEEMHSRFILVPDGAECLLNLPAVNEYRFTKLVNSDVYCFNPHGQKEWYKSANYEDITGTKNTRVLWQRHTQPEELPFIDDEQEYKELDQLILENSETVAIPESWLKGESKPHNHYFKDVSELNEIDVYQVLRLFNVTDPCLQHIVKKALCAGQRGHKDFETDLKNIFDTAKRALEINNVSHNQGS